MRRLISRLVLLVAVLLGVLTLGANIPLTSHRTAETWPNPMGTDTIASDYVSDYVSDTGMN